MDNQTKLQLSPLEFELMNNSEWILTKNNILKKTQWLLEQVQQNILDYTRLHPALFPGVVITVSPKISKGENYRGLPWLMLDYPRYFDKDNTFAIRTMFWWGNFFSTTLHLSGIYNQKYYRVIVDRYEDLCKNEFYCCVNNHQWHHHFEKENYLAVGEFSLSEFTQLMQDRSFVKLSYKLPLSEWDRAVNLLSEGFVRIANWLS